jgi:hypothetical protein
LGDCSREEKKRDESGSEMLQWFRLIRRRGTREFVMIWEKGEKSVK